MKQKLIEFALYVAIVSMILFILGNYKYQPALSADELEAVEQFNEVKTVQTDFVTKNESDFAPIDLTNYKVNSGYSDLLLLIQDLLQVQAVSGYYNEQTAEAVRVVQQAAQLEVTGEIDEETLAAIMDEVLPLSETELRSRGDLVRLIQQQLNLPDDGMMGESTRQALEQLKMDLQSDEENLVYDGLINEAVMTYLIEQLDH